MTTATANTANLLIGIPDILILLIYPDLPSFCFAVNHNAESIFRTEALRHISNGSNSGLILLAIFQNITDMDIRYFIG